ncbi:MAG: hypothetical protein LBP53_00830 [Candidatus Peribacteria bacterium]|jgi:hypothetical protein|nr:hypothetical protein [Candidatus Peribacteria bacterium]
MIYNQQKLDCETCPSGEHPNEAGTACEKCPAGQEWKNGKCEAIAEQCSNGTEKPANGECPPVATPSNPSNTNDARKACKEQEKAGTHRRNPSKKECEDCSKVCC